MISKSEFFYSHAYEFDFSGVVEGWGRLYTLCMGVFLAYILH